MIAHLIGRTGENEYVPLGWDPVARRWNPLIGDRGRVGFLTWSDAVRTCVAALEERLAGIGERTQRLSNLASYPNGLRTLREQRDMADLAREVAQTFTVVEIEMARLLDEPNPYDVLDIEAYPEKAVKVTADVMLVGCVADCMIRSQARTREYVTTAGIDDAVTLLSSLRDRCPPPDHGDNDTNTGGDTAG